MRSMILAMEDAGGGVIGRDAEIADIEAFLATSGMQFAQLTLEGEAGIGKTTLWWEALRQASARGARVIITRPSESEATLSFAALADLFDSVDDAMIEKLPVPQQEAIAAALLRAPVPPQGIDELALCAAVLSLLRFMSAQQPLVVAVDDAHWLDPPSARGLIFAARRLRAEHVLFLMTVRTGTTRRLRLDLAADPNRRHALRLGPLTLASLHELIKRRTRQSLPRHAVAQIERATGGNALYALEIATELAGRPLEGGVLPVPASLSDLVAARLGRLPAACRQALLIAAALAQPTTELVDASALIPAERGGLVSIEQNRIRFTHPLFASVVYSRAGAPERRRVHRDLAAVMRQPEERARHAALGAAAADEAIAAELEAAANLAGLRGAPDTAGQLLELAVRLTPASHAANRPAREVAAARRWFDAGDLVRSEALVEQMLQQPQDRTHRAEALQLLGQLHARRSSFARAMAVGLEALELATGDPELQSGIQLDLTYYCVSLGDFAGAERYAGAAVAATEEASMPGALADSLAVLVMAEFLRGGGVDERRMRRARQMEDPNRVRAWQCRPTFLHGLLLLWTCRLDEARAALSHMHIETLERGEDSPVPFACMYLTWACVWQGDLAAAHGYAAEALRAAALLDDLGSHATALSASALVHAHDGSIALAREEAMEAVRCFQLIGWPSGTIWPLWALGLVELSEGNPEAVDAALAPLTDLIPVMGEFDPVLSVFLPDHIEALVELGQLERAEGLIAWLERRGVELDRAWAIAIAGRCRGLLLAARGNNDGALTALAAALVEHDRLRHPVRASAHSPCSRPRPAPQRIARAGQDDAASSALRLRSTWNAHLERPCRR